MNANVIPLQNEPVQPIAGSPIAQSYEQASAYVAAIGATGQIIDFRAIHDANKAIPAIPFRDTLENAWSSIRKYNNDGYGIFAVVAAMDGVGRHLVNVIGIRAHYVDLDNLSAMQNYQRASVWTPAPSFAVQSSPGKYHVYWPVAPYAGNDYFTLIQRKLRQFFDGDGKVIDAARVMRLPGTIHSKGEPHLVTCHALPGYGQMLPVTTLEAALQHVNVIDGGNGGRHELGEPSLAAPSLDWIRYALKHTDPNNLDRGDWISFSAAIKQAGWSTTDPDTLYQEWLAWCARYDKDDVGENFKQWDSIRTTEVGWPAIMRKVPSIAANLRLGAGGNRPKHAIPGMTPVNDSGIPAPGAGDGPTPAGEPATPPMPEDIPRPPADDLTGELLTAQEQEIWFKDCVLIGPESRIIGPRGIRYDAGSFNASYGGKQFIISQTGKVTDEPWKAATRSTLWTVPKVDGTCFRPDQQTGAIVRDGLGRSYVNTYVPAKIETLEGEVSPFLRHLGLILPNANDQRILLEYIAHNVRYPGRKIQWAPLIQSVEGVGKNVFKQILLHSIDKQYFYQPKAKQLNEGGSKFNGWMDSKLFFLVDEIKTDDKRDMVETLKPFITETSLEIEGKGVNQKMGETPGNWMFFSNHKDAIPIHKNGRRFAIFYSAVQTVDDLQSRGMDDAYFNSLYGWLGDDQNGGHKMGLKIVANYLLNYPIERGAIAKRAPDTSSMAEALIESRGWLGHLIAEAVEDEASGFRGGWV